VADVAESIGEAARRRPVIERRRLERSLARAAEVLDEPARAAAWAEGRAMTTEEAIQYALETE
jgi:hypothetical protein